MIPESLRTRDGKTLTLRMCQGLEELDACVRLQVETWGYAGGDIIPRRLFTVAQRIGGQAIGAFDHENRMIGFAMSLPGLKAGKQPQETPKPYLHSHMLAVLPAWRNSGIGRALKLYQRREAISRSISLMEWTFDPLEIKNAHLNVEKLGAIVRRYTLNQYGTSSSPLQGGLPTDRCVAEWWLRSKRVTELFEDGRRPQLDPEKTIVVPAEIYEWKADPAKRDRAREVQLANRQQFLNAFSSGLVVLGYRRDQSGNGTFLLAQPQEKFEFSVAPEREAEPSCR